MVTLHQSPLTERLQNFLFFWHIRDDGHNAAWIAQEAATATQSNIRYMIEPFTAKESEVRQTAYFLSGLLSILPLQTCVAFAEGFKTYDLREIEQKVAHAFGRAFKVSVKKRTISADDVHCQTIKLVVDRQNDNFGQKDMSEADYFRQLEEACNQEGLPCEIKELSVGSIVGRVTSIRLVGGRVSVNITFLKDGDRLTIRSAGKTKAIAQKNAQIALGVMSDKL